MCNRKGASQKYVDIPERVMTRLSSSEPILFDGFVYAKISVLLDSAFPMIYVPTFQSTYPVSMFLIKTTKGLFHIWNQKKRLCCPIRFLFNLEHHMKLTWYNYQKVKSEVRLKSGVAIKLYDNNVIVDTGITVNLVTAILTSNMIVLESANGWQ